MDPAEENFNNSKNHPLFIVERVNTRVYPDLVPTTHELIKHPWRTLASILKLHLANPWVMHYMTPSSISNCWTSQHVMSNESKKPGEHVNSYQSRAPRPPPKTIRNAGVLSVVHSGVTLTKYKYTRTHVYVCNCKVRSFKRNHRALQSFL